MSDSKQTIDPTQLDPEAQASSSGSPPPEDGAERLGDAPPAAVSGDEGGGSGDGAAELAGDLDELGAIGAQRDEYLSLEQRTQAAFENYRKRVARESALAQERGVAKLAKELLPALDNLDRALGAAAKDDPLLDGVRLVRSELSGPIARAGVRAISRPRGRFRPGGREG